MTRVRAPRTIRITRYVTPLREGGSLPAIVEADDDGLYVLKFRGAGQGARALVAELVSGEIARALGLPVPELVFAELDRDLARTEPDPEIHALIHDSAGLNLALDYLPGSVTFDPVVARARRRPGVADRLVRRLRHQRRSHRAQHQHADVAPPAVADRPRRDALLPPRAGLGADDARRARSVPAASRITCCSPARSALAAVDAALAAALGRRTSSTRSSSWIPEAWLAGDGPGRRSPRRGPRTCATCASGWSRRGRSWRRRARAR